MATNIFNYDGTLRTTVADGALDNTTSIKIPGRGYLNYGEPVNENMLWIMQHFANTSAPTNPVVGQAWFDTTDKILKIYTGSSWISAGGVVQSPTPPSSPTNPGELWFDTTNKQLNVWSGTAWKIVGPLGSAINTDPLNPTVPTYSEIDAARLSDGTAYHSVWRVIVAGTVIAIISKDASFTPSPAITGFSVIEPGINLNSTIAGIGVTDATSWKSTKTNLPSADNLYNIGSATYRLANMYAVNFNGIASSAKYADLAERYLADEPLEHGTVVCLGGAAEVEACRVEGTDSVFGIVSTDPAYLMNAEAGDDDKNPAIALVGRVPCKVVGPVHKGQRLMASAIVGCACAYDSSLYGSLSVLGRALEAKDTDDIGIIEVVVGKN